MKNVKERAKFWSKVCLWAYIAIFIVAVIGTIYMAIIGLPYGTIFTVFFVCLAVCAGIAIFETNFLRPIYKD